MSSRKELRLVSQGRFSEAKDAKKSKKREREAVEKEVVEVEVDIDSDDVDDDDKGTILRPTKKRGTDSTKMGQGYVNKQRVLIIASRGITARHRYFLDDLRKIIPHHKRDNKLDSKGDINALNEIAELKSCNQCLYLECRKRQDLYMYVGKTPNGPSAKFQVVNIHTMEELKLTGNCMIGSRPLLNFDVGFEANAHFTLMKALLTDAFNTPKGHPKSKPFLDRIMSFFIVKNNIWVRNYQIVENSERERKDGKDTQLVEIGPRFVLIPIRIFSGSLGGATMYQNAAFVSPNDERAQMKRSMGDKYKKRVEHNRERKILTKEWKPEVNELAGTRMFK